MDDMMVEAETARDAVAEGLFQDEENVERRREGRWAQSTRRSWVGTWPVMWKWAAKKMAGIHTGQPPSLMLGRRVAIGVARQRDENAVRVPD